LQAPLYQRCRLFGGDYLAIAEKNKMKIGDIAYKRDQGEVTLKLLLDN
jgi:hypothetical protein